MLEVVGIGDEILATEEQRQTLLEIMRLAEVQEIGFRRAALTARKLVEKIDVARGLVSGRNEGDIEPRFTFDFHEENHARDGRGDTLNTLRKLDVPALREHSLLRPPRPAEHQVIGGNEDQHERTGLDSSNDVAMAENDSAKERSQKSSFPNSDDGGVLPDPQDSDYDDALPEL